MHILVENHKGREFGKHRCRCEDDIKMYLIEIECEVSGYGPMADTCEHNAETSGSVRAGYLPGEPCKYHIYTTGLAPYI
jgi:hypothetical protein